MEPIANVLSIKQIKHLESLGLDTSDAIYYYNLISNDEEKEISYRLELYDKTDHTFDSVAELRSILLEDNKELVNSKEIDISQYKFKNSSDKVTIDDLTIIPTYTFSEIVRKLQYNDKYKIFINYDRNSIYLWNFVDLKNEHTEIVGEENSSLLDCAYKMLCWSIENKYIKNK